ncbi:hypothetical protein CRE_15581 [Caenorhabditis remanei]|uniref:Uncharacterized protein n=1 Tax=Caenorhabditis remanei TaxID=31234 RepID=E3MT23_CAERE|nr:hypothetical protein CRE_15581 [Caenorhabditis remanei]
MTASSASSDFLALQEQLKVRNEQFKVLQEKFLEQRKELFEAKNGDSNNDFMNTLREKLENALEKNAQIEKAFAEYQKKKESEVNEISIKLKDSQDEKSQKKEDSYWNFVQIENLLDIMTGIDRTDICEMSKEKIDMRIQQTKESVEECRLKDLMTGYFTEVKLIEKMRNLEVEELTKKLESSQKLVEEYKKKAEESVESLRFESLMTSKIQEKINNITESLEYHKNLVTELNAEKEKGKKIEEGLEDDEDDFDDEEEDFDDEEDIDHEEEDDQEDSSDDEEEISDEEESDYEENEEDNDN